MNVITFTTGGPECHESPVSVRMTLKVTTLWMLSQMTLLWLPVNSAQSVQSQTSFGIFSSSGSSLLPLSDKCFCQLDGVIDDCSCKVDTGGLLTLSWRSIPLNSLLFLQWMTLIIRKYFRDWRAWWPRIIFVTFNTSLIRSAYFGTAPVGSAPATIVR